VSNPIRIGGLSDKLTAAGNAVATGFEAGVGLVSGLVSGPGGAGWAFEAGASEGTVGVLGAVVEAALVAFGGCTFAL